MDPMLRQSPFGDEPEGEGDFLSGVAKIALGIFFGALLVWLVVELRARYELRQIEREAAAMIEQHNTQLREAQERRERRAREVQWLQADQAQKSAQRQREALAAQRRKDAAWAQFYQPLPQCLESTSVECGNAHIRARRDFERRYAAGEL